MRSATKRWGVAALCLATLVLCGVIVKKTKTPLHEQHQWSHALFDRHGQLLRITLSSDDKYRLWIPIDQIAPEVKEAILIKEDRHFYHHLGINPLALVKAFINTYWKGERRVGASTITMQLARLHYNLYTRNLLGKLGQIISALYLEFLYSKREIFQAYLNLAPFGHNIEGVAAASHILFQKAPSELNLSESLYLSIIPQNPSRFKAGEESGHGKKSYRRALDKWIEQHPLSNSSFDLLENPPPTRLRSELPFLAPHFVQQLIEENPDDRQIHSTLDLTFQKMLEERISDYVEIKSKEKVTNAAGMILDYTTMEVLAQVGSADFFNDTISGQVDGTRSDRSPGSTLKPFVYALAFDQGLIHPQSLLYDAPLRFRTPKNFDLTYKGPISVEDALITSRNIPAVELSSQLKRPTFFQFLNRLGMTAKDDESHYGHSIVIGGMEISMQQLVALYAALANGGKFRNVKYLLSPNREEGSQIISRESAVMVKDILKKNPRPGNKFTGSFVKTKRDVYWKTGTSFGFKDAWSIGIFGKFVLAIWVGNFDGKSNNAFIGSLMAGPLFFQVVDSLNSMDRTDLSLLHHHAPKLSTVKVCALSGSIPHKHCPHLKETLFIPGVTSVRPCPVHRLVDINQENGLRACVRSKGTIVQHVFEFWPSDILHIFKKQGLERTLPPPFEKVCQNGQFDPYATPPKIISPRIGKVYHIRIDDQLRRKIPLLAQNDPGVQYNYWYLNNQFLGKTKPGAPLFHQLVPGDHHLKVVDDLGRVATRKLTIVLTQ